MIKFRYYLFSSLLFLTKASILAEKPALSTGKARAKASTLPAPLFVSNQFPFFFGLVPPPIASSQILRVGSYETSLSMDIASHTVSVQTDKEYFILDGETYQNTLAFQQGFHKNLEWGISLPYFSSLGPKLDGLIESWHSFIGFSRPKSNTIKPNNHSFVYERNGLELLSISERIEGLGDLSLMLAYQRENSNTALRTMLRLPTGSREDLSGSGNTSGAVWYSAAHIVSEDGSGGLWYFMHGVGFFITNGQGPIPALRARNQTFGTIALAWQPSKRGRNRAHDLSFIFQANANSSVYANTGLSYLSNPAIMIAIGARLAIGQKTQFDFSINEDIAAESPVPDVIFHLLLRHRF